MCTSAVVGSWETWPQATAVLKNVAQRRTRRLLRNLQQRGKYKCCPCHLTCFPFWFSYLAKSWYPVVEEWKTSKFFPVKGRTFQGGSRRMEFLIVVGQRDSSFEGQLEKHSSYATCSFFVCFCKGNSFLSSSTLCASSGWYTCALKMSQRLGGDIL